MKHAYSGEFSYPPALIMPAKVGVRYNPLAVESYRAKIDTASDLSVVPRGFFDKYRPPTFYRKTIRQTGREEYSYLLEIELDGHVYTVEVVPHNARYVLIGRDILNQLTLIADGTNEVFELQRPIPPQSQGRGRRVDLT